MFLLTRHSSVLQIIFWNWKQVINRKIQAKKFFWHVTLHSYFRNVLCKFLIKVESTWRCVIKEHTPLLTLLYCGKTVTWKSAVMSKRYFDVSYIYCFMYLKVQDLDCMKASGFSVRVTGLVFFIYKLASMVLNRCSTCVRKPKKNAFSESIKILH